MSLSMVDLMIFENIFNFKRFGSTCHHQGNHKRFFIYDRNLQNN